MEKRSQRWEYFTPIVIVEKVIQWNSLVINYGLFVNLVTVYRSHVNEKPQIEVLSLLRTNQPENPNDIWKVPGPSKDDWLFLIRLFYLITKSQTKSKIKQKEQIGPENRHSWFDSNLTLHFSLKSQSKLKFPFWVKSILTCVYEFTVTTLDQREVETRPNEDTPEIKILPRGYYPFCCRGPNEHSLFGEVVLMGIKDSLLNRFRVLTKSNSENGLETLVPLPFVINRSRPNTRVRISTSYCNLGDWLPLLLIERLSFTFSTMVWPITYKRTYI